MSQPLASTSPRTTAAPRAPRVPFFQNGVLRAFAAMPLGRLRLELPDGSIREFGEPDVAPRTVAPGVSNTACLRVRRPAS